MFAAAEFSECYPRVNLCAAEGITDGLEYTVSEQERLQSEIWGVRAGLADGRHASGKMVWSARRAEAESVVGCRQMTAAADAP